MKALTLRLDDALHARVKHSASLQMRSISSYILFGLADSHPEPPPPPPKAPEPVFGSLKGLRKAPGQAPD